MAASASVPCSIADPPRAGKRMRTGSDLRKTAIHDGDSHRLLCKFAQISSDLHLWISFLVRFRVKFFGFCARLLARDAHVDNFCANTSIGSKDI